MTPRLRLRPDSSWIRGTYYHGEGDGKGLLFLLTRDGRWLVYERVPGRVHTSICNSKSAGKAFRRLVRGKYRMNSFDDSQVATRAA